MTTSLEHLLKAYEEVATIMQEQGFGTGGILEQGNIEEYYSSGQNAESFDNKDEFSLPSHDDNKNISCNLVINAKTFYCM